MSVQLYVSGERPRSFPTLAAFVTYVRSTYIESDRPAVAPASPIGAASPRTEGGASGTAERVPSAVASSAVPPSNETTGQGSHPCPAVGAAVTARKQV